MTSVVDSVLESPIGSIAVGNPIADRLLKRAYNSPRLSMLPDTATGYVTLPSVIGETHGKTIHWENEVDPPSLEERIGDLTYNTDVGNPTSNSSTNPTRPAARRSPLVRSAPRSSAAAVIARKPSRRTAPKRRWSALTPSPASSVAPAPSSPTPSGNTPRRQGRRVPGGMTRRTAGRLLP